MNTPRQLDEVSAAVLLDRLYDKEARIARVNRHYYRNNAMILLLQDTARTGFYAKLWPRPHATH